MAQMRFLVVAIILVAAIGSAYWSVRGHDFIKLDDEDYITKNLQVQQGLTWEGVKWAFSAVRVGNWHPLTWLSHMLDCELFGINPAGHHLMSVGWHAANALLLLAGLRLMTGAFWPSAGVALLWAIHPLRVESVAWAAERKDVLAAFFGLLCIVLYALYARRGGAWRYGAVCASLALGLMCKPMLVTWPCLLLLLDFWPLRRVRFGEGANLEEEPFRVLPLRKLLLEKVPLLALVMASSIVTMFAQSAVFTTLGDLSVGTRLANAAIACANYLADTFWPTGLAIMYPHPMEFAKWPVVSAAALLACVSMVVLALWKRAPWLVVGWLWFLGTLVPVVGIVQVGAQSHADRYTYLPQIGVIIAVVWTMWRLVGRRDVALIVLMLPLSIGLWLQTRHQVGFWRNSETVFRRALAVTQKNWPIESGMGGLALERGDFITAEWRFRRAFELAPNHPRTQVPLGDVLLQRGALADARTLFEAALSTEPGNHGALNNLAWILATAPQPTLRDEQRAVRLAEEACRLLEPEHSEYPNYLDTLSAAYASVGRFDDAIATAQRGREMALQRNNEKVAAILDGHLQRYRQRLPAQ